MNFFYLLLSRGEFKSINDSNKRGQHNKLLILLITTIFSTRRYEEFTRARATGFVHTPLDMGKNYMENNL